MPVTGGGVHPIGPGQVADVRRADPDRTFMAGNRHPRPAPEGSLTSALLTLVWRGLTVCLYSAASMLARSLSAVAQSVFLMSSSMGCR